MLFAVKVVFAVCAAAWILLISAVATVTDTAGFWPTLFAWALAGPGPVLLIGWLGSMLGRLGSGSDQPSEIRRRRPA